MAQTDHNLREFVFEFAIFRPWLLVLACHQYITGFEKQIYFSHYPVAKIFG